jgi:hypothetical protein
MFAYKADVIKNQKKEKGNKNNKKGIFNYQNN